ncbi:MAG: hypothetical protein RMJ87_11740 [Cytophagales bacterium]|nr:hypothetical protein [Bernardetiaceae bacterium]MDW8205692.1 hypothetical protein [Cytophagales bacterium]
MRGNAKYIAIVVGSFLLLLLIEYLSPKPIDWNATYKNDDVIPYGNYILYRELPKLLNQPIEENNQTFYERLLLKDTAIANYILIQENLSIDSLDALALLQLVRAGSNVFIAAQYISSYLRDSLLLDINDNVYAINKPLSEELTDSVGVFMVNPNLELPSLYFLKRGTASYHLESRQSATVLSLNTYRVPVYIRVPYGKGNFWLHSVPIMFTNYYMLYRNHREYIAATFSYLPPHKIVWDEYYKNKYRGKSYSPVRFLLAQPQLAWAWRLLLFTTLIFALFGIKRRQRAIPIVQPPENTSLEFVKIVGRLYFLNPHHKAIADYKIRFFIEQLRTKYGISITLPAEFVSHDKVRLNQIAQKTGVDKELVQRLFQQIAQIESTLKPEISEHDLLQLSRLIEDFYAKQANQKNVKRER